jgi:hypothetical protein
MNPSARLTCQPVPTLDLLLDHGSTQTMPLARPSFSDPLAAVDFAIERHFPARGHSTVDI